MARFMKPQKDPEQMSLLPANIEDVLPLDNMVYKLKHVMKQIDYSELESTYSIDGRPAYHPSVMMSLLVYSYIDSTRGSRKIEEHCKYDMRYIYLCDNFKPDHNTIARFRSNKKSALLELFAQTLLLCVKEGLVKANCIAVDGSKFEANASRKNLYGKEEVELARKAAARMIAEAEAIDEAEDKEAQEKKAELQRKAEVCEKKASQAERLLEETGKNKVSLSDPESRTMKTSNGIRACYNAQVAVDTESGVILSAYLTNAENDHQQLPETLKNIEKILGRYPDMVLADTGYSDDVNFGFVRENGINALIPVQIHKSAKNKENDPYNTKNFIYDEERDVMVCPAGKYLTFRKTVIRSNGRLYLEYMKTGCKGCEHCELCCKSEPTRRKVCLSLEHKYRDDMTRRMSLPENKKVFSKRKETIEPTFGDFKRNRNLRMFNLKGLEGATCELLVMCIAHNLRKLASCACFQLFLPYFRVCKPSKYRVQEAFTRIMQIFGLAVGFMPEFGQRTTFECSQ